jgi:hypothetical protein
MFGDIGFSVDWIGYAGSLCVLSAFCMRQMMALRITSIVGNMVFIAFGSLAGVMPVLVMNGILLVLNSFRLLQDLRARAKSA